MNQKYFWYSGIIIVTIIMIVILMNTINPQNEEDPVLINSDISATTPLPITPPTPSLTTTPNSPSPPLFPDNEIAGWEIYRNERFGFEVKYPLLYQQETPAKSSLRLQGESVASFSYQDTNQLDIAVLEDNLKDYRLNDEAGGFIFHFDVGSKQWLHQNNQTSKFAPKKIDISLESYIYSSGDVNCSWDQMIIPHPSYPFVVEIVNTTCSKLDTSFTPHRYIPAPFDLKPEEILSTFKFIN